MINFNSQDVANMYRRNQLANALQERMNAPTPVHTYQGFQAPISPLTGISKALDMYTAKKYDDQQEEKYQAEKAAAEQKVLDENSRLEQGRENFVSNLNQPIYSETPMPDARSSSESGIPLDQPRNDVYTSTPKTPQEKLAFALSRIGDPNQLVSTTAKGYVDQANEDIKAKSLFEQAKLNLQEKRDDRIENKQTKVEIAIANNEAKKEVAQIMGGLRRDQIEDSAQIKRDAVNLKIKEKTDAESKAFNDSNDVINNIESDVESLNALGGLRNENQNPYQSSVATFGNMLPAVFQSKEALELREKIDANIEALVPVLMKASGMSARQLDSNVERTAFRKSLGGTGTGYEANNKIIERMRNMIKPSSLQSNEFPSKENALTTNPNRIRIYNPDTRKIE